MSIYMEIAPSAFASALNDMRLEDVQEVAAEMAAELGDDELQACMNGLIVSEEAIAPAARALVARLTEAPIDVLDTAGGELAQLPLSQLAALLRGIASELDDDGLEQARAALSPAAQPAAEAAA